MNELQPWLSLSSTRLELMSFSTAGEDKRRLLVISCSVIFILSKILQTSAQLNERVPGEFSVQKQI